MGNKREKLSFELFSTGLSTGVAYKNRSLKRQIILAVDTKNSGSINELSKEINTSVQNNLPGQ